MKNKSTILVIILITILTCAVKAQIPNNGFENWAVEDGNNNPVGWETTNDSPYTSTTPYTPAYAGNYSMKVTVVDYGIFAISGIAQVEFPFNQRPNSLQVCYKSNIMPGDKAYVTIALAKGDTLIAAAGDCSFVIDSTVNEFTCYSIPITFLNDWYPTTANIMVIAGNETAQVGTTIIVDELSFDGTASVGNTTKEAYKIDNYPNPARDYTYLPINLMRVSDVEVIIMDINGKQVQSIHYQALPSGKNDLLVNTIQFPNGIYTYSVRNKDFSYFGKMVVSR